jgi:hypothetical protein
MEQQDIEQLAAAVQRNCHISDARHGADYGLCSYLMKMREYYRWEKNLGFEEQLSNDGVGNWLLERERLWERLEHAEFAEIPVVGRRYQPFDTEGINRALRAHGLVYSGGLGRRARAHFFLGRLERRDDVDGYQVCLVGEELARDLTAPAAMCGERAIFLRRQSLRRLLWEKLENWRWARADTPLGRAFASYDFDSDLEGALECMTESELRTIYHHELGEYQVGQELGPEWNNLLLAVSGTPAERMLRAVRDNWVDCRVTIPALLEESREASLHFLIGNMSAMSRELFPSLDQGYRKWCQNREAAALLELVRRGADHWGRLAKEALQLYWRSPDSVASTLKSLMEGNRF